MISIYTDGATEGPNGKLGTVKFCGIGIYCPDTDFQYSKRIPAISNNEAEFWALITAMKWASLQEFKNVQFFLDSKIVINRAKGRRPTKPKWRNERMDKLQQHVLDMIPLFRVCNFIWIPREQNWKADQLSKACLEGVQSNFQRRF